MPFGRSKTWKDHIYRKRAELAGMLHVPMASLAHACLPLLGDRLSCDGSHYMTYDEFLRKDMSFWLGIAA